VKRGRTTWVAKVPAAELQAVNEWIDASANYAAADIYRHLNLVRYTHPRSFRQYVADRRAKREREEEGVLPPSSFSQERLEQMARDVLGQALLSGELPAYVLPKVLSSLAQSGGLELKRQAYEEARAKLRQAADQATQQGTRTLSRDEVYEVVDSIMRGAA